jgi:hypothetical protein
MEKRMQRAAECAAAAARTTQTHTTQGRPWPLNCIHNTNIKLTTALEGQYVCALLWKKSLKAERTRAPGHSVAIVCEGRLETKRDQAREICECLNSLKRARARTGSEGASVQGGGGFLEEVVCVLLVFLSSIPAPSY